MITVYDIKSDILALYYRISISIPQKINQLCNKISLFANEIQKFIIYQRRKYIKEALDIKK